MKHRKIYLVTAISLFAGFAAFAAGTEGLGSGTETDHVGAHSTVLTAQQFANSAGSAGKAEVELARLALERSQNTDVRQFAQMMLDDHSKANTALASLASSKNLELPASITPEQQAAADKLKKESGSAFDQAYVAQMVNDHTEAVDLFEDATQASTLDPDIRQFAEKTLPTLQHHKQQATQLAATLR
jgi:putative membrane protein